MISKDKKQDAKRSFPPGRSTKLAAALPRHTRGKRAAPGCHRRAPERQLGNHCMLVAVAHKSAMMPGSPSTAPSTLLRPASRPEPPRLADGLPWPAAAAAADAPAFGADADTAAAAADAPDAAAPGVAPPLTDIPSGPCPSTPAALTGPCAPCPPPTVASRVASRPPPALDAACPHIPGIPACRPVPPVLTLPPPPRPPAASLPPPPSPRLAAG